MPPTSEAAACLGGLLLSSEMARAHDSVAARAFSERALALAAPPRSGRDGHLERVQALVVAAEAALATGDDGSATRELAEALETATGWQFLPALLGACAAALPLLSAGLTDEVRGWVARHPAAPYALRVPWTAAAGASGPFVVPAERDARWAQALEVAQQVREALAG